MYIITLSIKPSPLKTAPLLITNHIKDVPHTVTDLKIDHNYMLHQND